MQESKASLSTRSYIDEALIGERDEEMSCKSAIGRGVCESECKMEWRVCGECKSERQVSISTRDYREFVRSGKG